MKKAIYILIIILTSQEVDAQNEDFFGGVEVGLSTAKLNLDSIDAGFTFSPVIGFSFQKQFLPKIYGGISTVFTQKKAKIISPSVSYQLNYIDWRLSLQYRIQPNLFIEGGAAISQYITGRTKSSNGDKVDLKGVFFHQTNPYFGLRYKVKNNLISAKYYLPNLILKSNGFSPKNQFTYGEITVNIPFKPRSEDKLKQVKEDKDEAERQVKALKSGILLVALSGKGSKNVKDRELDQLLVEAFKNYKFSKYFIVDDQDLDSLRITNRIAVYEDYPFSEKQKINLENFTWFIAQAGEQAISQENGSESYSLKVVLISDSEGVNLVNPFPYYINYSGGNLTEAITSFNSQLERFYYEASFGL